MCYWKENISKTTFSRQNLTVFLSILFNNLPCLLLYCTGSLQISPFDKILSPIQVTKLIVPSKVQNQLLPCFQKYMLFSVSKVKTAKMSNRQAPCYTVWLQMAKKRRKCIHLMRFHEFFQTTFLFPVISHAFIFKICQTVASTSIINQISRFFLNIIFGGFLPLGPAAGKVKGANNTG